jgi:hypothetical protein
MVPNVPSSQPDGRSRGPSKEGPTGAGKPTHPGGLGEGSKGEAHPNAFIPLRSRLTLVKPAAAAVEGREARGTERLRCRNPQLRGVRPKERPDPEPGRSYVGGSGSPEWPTGKPGGRGGSRFAGQAPALLPGRQAPEGCLGPLDSDDPSGRRTTLQ